MTDIQTPPGGTEPEIETPQTQEPETPQAPTDEVVETPTEPTPEQPSSQPEPEPYKEKFKESAKEGILLNERVKVRDAQIESLTKQDTPTDEAMRQVYPAWDGLDDFTKGVLIKQETQEMKQRRMEARQQEIDSRQKLEDELDAVVENSEFALKLKGKETDFKRFARNPKNRGIAAETLAKAFLFDAEDESPPAKPTPMKEALPAGSGGPRGDLKPKKISIEEARKIRETDYKRYIELVKTNQIEEIE